MALKAPFTWDADRAEYRDARGAVVPKSAVKGAVEALIAGAQAEIRGHAARLQAGGLDLLTWQLAMADTLRALHTASAAAGKGGWDAMQPADWGRVGYLTKQQYGYLAGFAGALVDGAVDVQSAGFAQRAELYGGAARQTYEQSARIAALEAPALTQEHNHLGSADHCRDCLAATAQGWVDIGELIPPGARVCGPNCRCEIEFR